MPNQKAKIEVTYDTERLGVFNKSVVIYSNSKNQKDIAFIKGNVLDKKKSDKADKM